MPKSPESPKADEFSPPDAPAVAFVPPAPPTPVELALRLQELNALLPAATAEMESADKTYRAASSKVTQLEAEKKVIIAQLQAL